MCSVVQLLISQAVIGIFKDKYLVYYGSWKNIIHLTPTQCAPVINSNDVITTQISSNHATTIAYPAYQK